MKRLSREEEVQIVKSIEKNELDIIRLLLSTPYSIKIILKLFNKIKDNKKKIKKSKRL